MEEIDIITFLEKKNRLKEYQKIILKLIRIQITDFW